jgi:hypothetical protein
MLRFWDMRKTPGILQFNTSYFDVRTSLTLRPRHSRAELAVIRRKAQWSPKVCPHVPARVSVRARAGTRIIHSVSDQNYYSTLPEQ